MNKETLERIFEYASVPVHGTLSRKLRKGVKLQVNEGRAYENGVIFMGDGFVRITEQIENETYNTYLRMDAIGSVRTIGKSEES